MKCSNKYIFKSLSPKWKYNITQKESGQTNPAFSYFVDVFIEERNWYNFFEDNLEILTKVSKAYSF